MKPEVALYNKLKECFPGTFMRVENVAEPGCGDINGCYQGREYWIEFKVEEKEIESPVTFLRPAQQAWAAKRLQEYATIYYIIQYREENKIVLYAGINNPRPIVLKKIIGFEGRVNVVLKDCLSKKLLHMLKA